MLLFKQEQQRRAVRLLVITAYAAWRQIIFTLAALGLWDYMVHRVGLSERHFAAICAWREPFDAFHKALTMYHNLFQASKSISGGFQHDRLRLLR